MIAIAKVRLFSCLRGGWEVKCYRLMYMNMRNDLFVRYHCYPEEAAK